MNATFRRSWRARGPLDVLLAGLAPERTPELHPLVEAVEELRPDGGGWRYWLRERVPLGPLSIPNRYAVRWERPTPETLRMEAWSWPRVYLLHLLRFHPAPEGVAVEHEVWVEAPWPLRAYVRATAARAHEAWIERVRAWVVAESLRREAGDARIEGGHRGGPLLCGERAGLRWDILSTGDGPQWLRVKVAADPGLQLARATEFGIGGLDGAGFASIAEGAFRGWLLKGPAESLAALPEWVRAALLREPGASLVDGDLVIVGEGPLQALAAL